MKQKLKLILLWFFLISLGCASQNENLPSHTEIQPTHEEEQKANQTKSLTVLPLTMEAYNFPASGKPERNMAREPAIKKNIWTALEKQFSSQGIISKIPDESSFSEDQKKNQKETLALFNIFMKVGDSNTSYSLGSEVALLDPEADFILLVYAYEFISTEGRNSSQVASFILGLGLGLVTGSATAGTGLIQGDVQATMGIALINPKTGNIIWNKRVWKGEFDMVNESEKIEEMLGSAFIGFPWERLRQN